jgi:hypothetical protein
VQITVLGPQRRPTVDQVVSDLDPDARIAMVTAGWQERESEDGELRALLGGRGVNLGLHGRWLDVLERDPEFARAEAEHRNAVDELQELYVIQLDHALRATYAISRFGGGRPGERRPRLVAAAADARADALEVVRGIDERHIERVRAAHADFYAAWKPHERALVAAHRNEVHATLKDTAGLVVTGGHVGVLVRVLHLFNVAPFAPPAVVAWSAGAMALTERVVLFHDRAARGPSHAEIYDDGIGIIRGCVLLPHARRRLMVDDLTRMAALAARFAPARCLVLDDGMRLDFPSPDRPPTGARVVSTDGRIVTLEERA